MSEAFDVTVLRNASWTRETGLFVGNDHCDMDYKDLTEKFKSRAPLFERLLEEALYALKAALEQAAIKYHSLPSRVKSPESFLEKVKRRDTEEIQRGEWDPLKEVHDIVGLRVVCLYLSDVE